MQPSIVSENWNQERSWIGQRCLLGSLIVTIALVASVTIAFFTVPPCIQFASSFPAKFFWSSYSVCAVTLIGIASLLFIKTFFFTNKNEGFVAGQVIKDNSKEKPQAIKTMVITPLEIDLSNLHADVSHLIVDLRAHTIEGENDEILIQTANGTSISFKDFLDEISKTYPLVTHLTLYSGDQSKKLTSAPNWSSFSNRFKIDFAKTANQPRIVLFKN